MGDDPNQGRWPSRLTPHSSRAAIAQGAREIAVDDFVDSHLREQPGQMHADPDPPTARRPDAPPQPAPANAWGPAAPPRPGTNRTLPIPPAHTPLRTVPMAAVAMPQRPMQPPPGPPPPDDDDGGGRTMLLTPEQAAAAAVAQAGGLAGTLASPQAAPAKRSAPPATGMAGTMLMPMITGPSPSAPPPVPPASPAPAGLPPAIMAAQPAYPTGYVEPAQPQGPSPHYVEPARPQGVAPAAMPPVEPFPESTYEPPKRGGGLLWIGVLVGVLFAGGAAFAYWQGYFAALTGRGDAARAPESAAPTASPASTDTAPVVASAAPSASAVPATSASSPANAPPVDAKPLLSFEGALTVTSKTDAEVVLQGASVGRTNQRLVVRCGPKNVRLRSGITWLSPGQPVQINCMQENTVTIEATP